MKERTLSNKKRKQKEKKTNKRNWLMERTFLWLQNPTGVLKLYP